jgi:hypothetical protein
MPLQTIICAKTNFQVDEEHAAAAAAAAAAKRHAQDELAASFALKAAGIALEAAAVARSLDTSACSIHACSSTQESRHAFIIAFT